MICKHAVVESRLSIKKVMLDYFAVVETYPLAAIGPTKDYCNLARQKLFNEVILAIEKALAAVEEIKHVVK